MVVAAGVEEPLFGTILPCGTLLPPELADTTDPVI